MSKIYFIVLTILTLVGCSSSCEDMQQEYLTFIEEVNENGFYYMVDDGETIVEIDYNSKNDYDVFINRAGEIMSYECKEETGYKITVGEETYPMEDDSLCDDAYIIDVISKFEEEIVAVGIFSDMYEYKYEPEQYTAYGENIQFIIDVEATNVMYIKDDRVITITKKGE